MTRRLFLEPFEPDTVLAWFIGLPLNETQLEHKELWVIGTASDEYAIKDRVLRECPEPLLKGCYFQDEAATDSLFRELSRPAAPGSIAR